MLVADDGISDKIGPIVQLVCMTVNIGVHMVESVRVRVQHVELCGVSVRRVLRPSQSTERRGSCDEVTVDLASPLKRLTLRTAS